MNHSNNILEKDYLNLPANVPGKPWLDKLETLPVTNAKYEVIDNTIKLFADDS